MGSKHTWYGVPDAICHSKIVVSKLNKEEEEMKTTVEAKVTKFTAVTLNQVVGQAVVASFIQHNKYPQQTPLVSAIGINGFGNMIAAMHDCKNNILLHFKETKYILQ